MFSTFIIFIRFISVYLIAFTSYFQNLTCQLNQSVTYFKIKKS